MRRKDREMPRDFAEAVIDRCVYGVLATVNEDGTPYCIPLSIVREGEWLYFHSAQEGQKIDNLQARNRVCLCCVGETRVPEGRFTMEYTSAVVFGRAELVQGDDEKVHALRLLCLRYTPQAMADFDKAIARQLARTGVWKIHIDEISGKQNHL
ncbi:MAG: pyridoxamine 5'-phosphate oxidase family protein [Treponema sp.]|jgi:nitroimidazol reductase NimA-like FMN-containing flavoprotein (pyridoxamine 5'-phosphate oxidase superfamily)|nr:pyridoxamine 5'-phosphate oxidase family protein [Treponema sp.]